MEPILSKQEIAELLTSIRDDRGNEGAESAFAGVDSHPSPHREISLFDPGVTHEEEPPIDNLEIIINRFQTAFSSVLSHYLQRGVVMESNESSFMPFSAYLSEERSQSAATVIDLTPLKFPGIVCCADDLYSVLLEFMLGGTAPNDLTRGRSRTKLELHILQKVVSQLCTALERVFHQVIPLTCSPVRTVAACSSISHVEPTTQMAVFSMNMAIDSCRGRMDLLFPVKTFEPYRESLATVMQQNNLDQRRWVESITESLDETLVTVMARTEVLDLSVKQLIELKSGDLFFADREPGIEVDILVEGVAKFSGSVEQHKQKRNIRITSTVAQGAYL